MCQRWQLATAHRCSHSGPYLVQTYLVLSRSSALTGAWTSSGQLVGMAVGRPRHCSPWPTIGLSNESPNPKNQPVPRVQRANKPEVVWRNALALPVRPFMADCLCAALWRGRWPASAAILGTLAPKLDTQDTTTPTFKQGRWEASFSAISFKSQEVPSQQGLLSQVWFPLNTCHWTTLS